MDHRRKTPYIGNKQKKILLVEVVFVINKLSENVGILFLLTVVNLIPNTKKRIVAIILNSLALAVICRT